jgi:pantetheine-phosphate adenylyltransferase
MTMRHAIYAGSFDPLTNGHLDVLKASLAVADVVYAAIGIHPGATSSATMQAASRSCPSTGW